MCPRPTCIFVSASVLKITLLSVFHGRSYATLIAMNKNQIPAYITKMQDFIQHAMLEFKTINSNIEQQNTEIYKHLFNNFCGKCW